MPTRQIVVLFFISAGNVLWSTLLMAQDGPSVAYNNPLGGYETLVAMLGQTGFLVWFAWYAITHTMPRMQADYAGQLDKEREMFQVVLAEKNRTLDAHLQTFMAELRTERESRRAADDKFVEALGRMSEAIKSH